MALRDRTAAQPLAPVVTVTGGAGQIELPDAPLIDLPAALAVPLEPRIVGRYHRQTARLVSDEGNERQQLLAFHGQWCRFLLRRTTKIDPAGEVDRPARSGIEGRIAGGNAAHARGILAMAPRACSTGRA